MCPRQAVLSHDAIHVENEGASNSGGKMSVIIDSPGAVSLLSKKV